MPLQFLEQLFTTLRRDGILNSQRGVGGGYTLARPPEEITVLEVVQALDGRPGDEHVPHLTLAPRPGPRRAVGSAARARAVEPGLERLLGQRLRHVPGGDLLEL